MANRILSLGLLITQLGTSYAFPAPHQGVPRSLPERLLGSSFGIPGDRTFDYVIVGGGTAGLAVAARLAENTDSQIAVIEAGSFYEIGNSNISQIPAYCAVGTGKTMDGINPFNDWGFQTTPQAGLTNETAHYTRGKCLGGSSARNYLTYQRSNAGAYDRWAERVGDDSYAWEKFLPYFEKSISFTPPDSAHRPANATPSYDISTLSNGKGPLSLTYARYAHAFSTWAQIALQTLGINPISGFNSGNLFGSANQLFTLDPKDMVRDSSETSFLRKVGLPQTNLIVYQSMMATRIIFDDNRNAIGVSVNGEGVEFVLSARQEVILSAGAFQSPQLLMVSGVGPAETLQRHSIPVIADRPGVGQNMQDHVLGGPSYRVNVVTASSLNDPDFLEQITEQYLMNRTGFLTAGIDDLLAFERLPAEVIASLDAQTQADLATLPNDWPQVEYLPASAYFGYQANASEAPTDGYNYATMAVAPQVIFSRGSVDIQSGDVMDAPIINPNWLTHPTDQAIAVTGYKRVRQLFQAMSPILIGAEFFPSTDMHVQSDAEILDIIRNTFFTVYHASCTCAMGRPDDAMTVIDSHARVIGVNRLRVVDASALPLLPPGHPLATIYALAEKIADEIVHGY